jgi:hypothetical protein
MMRSLLSFIASVNASICFMMLAGSLLMIRVEAGNPPPPVSDCTKQCTCSSVTNDCVGTMVSNCKSSCDCTGLAIPSCAWE